MKWNSRVHGRTRTKPHIFFFKSKIAHWGAHWVCVGDSHTGWGETPQEAYRYWKGYYEDSI